MKATQKEKEQMKKWYQKNKEKKKMYNQKYFEENKIDLIRKNEAYRQRTPVQKISRELARDMRRSLKNDPRAGKIWLDWVDFNVEELKLHLESQFQQGMTWDNHGEWHIDHVKPIGSFDFASVNGDGFKECWSLDNLRPLWAKDNHGGR